MDKVDAEEMGAGGERYLISIRSEKDMKEALKFS